MSMAPGLIDSISRPRAATSVSASSYENTPATHAAMSSPRLWPSSARGRTPSDCHNDASACSTMNSGRAGRSSSVPAAWRRTPPAPGGGTSNSRTSRPSRGRSSAAPPVDLGAEHRLRPVERGAHARVLRALPGKQKRDRWIAAALDHAGGDGRSMQYRRSLGPWSAHPCAAVRELSAPDLKGEAHVAEIEVGMPLEVDLQSLRCRRERGLVVSRQHHRACGTKGRAAGRRRRRFLQHGVGVGASKTERAHSGAPGAIVAGPGGSTPC